MYRRRQSFGGCATITIACSTASAAAVAGRRRELARVPSPLTPSPKSLAGPGRLHAGASAPAVRGCVLARSLYEAVARPVITGRLRRGLNGGLVGQEPLAGLPTWHLRSRFSALSPRLHHARGRHRYTFLATGVESARRSTGGWSPRSGGVVRSSPLRLRRKTQILLAM